MDNKTSILFILQILSNNTSPANLVYFVSKKFQNQNNSFVFFAANLNCSPTTKN